MLFAAVHESAFGPKRTSTIAPQMSAFGAEADMPVTSQYVRTRLKVNIERVKKKDRLKAVSP
jgi:hypothetical protein